MSKNSSNTTSTAQQIDKPTERRASPRTRYRDWAAIQVGNAKEAVAVKCIDVSKHGIGIISRSALRHGIRGIVQLIKEDGTAALLGIEVVRCEYKGDSRHESGLRFCDPPPSMNVDNFRNADGKIKLLHPLLKRVD